MKSPQVVTALVLGFVTASCANSASNNAPTTTSTTVSAPTSITINAISDKGAGKALGTITAEDSKDGLVLTTDLKGLKSGNHGMHVHENGSCDAQVKDGKSVAGLGAGGHYDPDKTTHHEGPQGKGHKGDLPALKVAADGSAKQKLVVPRLTMTDLKSRAIVIHEGGDNFADKPKPLGGGGARVACGVVK